MALWTQAYLHPKRSYNLLRRAGGSRCGLVALFILVRTFGGSWQDVGLAVLLLGAVFVVCSCLVAVLERS